MSFLLYIDTRLAIFYSVSKILNFKHKKKSEVYIMLITNPDRTNTGLIMTMCFIRRFWSSHKSQIILFRKKYLKPFLFFCKSSAGKFPLVSRRVHCFPKNELNNSPFSLKSVTSLLLLIKDGILGMFLLLTKYF